MSEQKDSASMKPGEYEKTGSGGYENPLEEDITDIDSETRRTSSGSDETNAKTSATPESGSEDTVVGSPNQGTESR
ncbi:hypothetical protein ACF3DV_07365 [Chlorogloeopsis fritschii PCC 9212]|uniref:Uncharacterized protein n=1 Tax=Chlorogloeopsis fritschii PCC 6912 TaxID=211165 RepID=A0A433N7I1_CHLFR|nr:hypothetical protein [Chlorogloeopsis fritschii]MBF2007642.1 hypothetical protein [Chlorogloeopsis fritschii C42_A2020_084]RUR77541.1 hypothetical protein PCC6912_39320 [Chlorogloeopsis fritschii PCC 6912]